MCVSKYSPHHLSRSFSVRKYKNFTQRFSSEMNTCIAILFSWPMYLCTNVEIIKPHLAPTETRLLVLDSNLFFVNESLVSCVSVTVTNWQTWWRLSTTILRLVCWSSRRPLHLDPPHTCLIISGIVAQNLKGSRSSNHLHQYLRKNITF
jgi:hypothetical protein